MNVIRIEKKEVIANKHEIIDALIDRVKYWTDDPEVIALFKVFYAKRLDAKRLGDLTQYEALDVPAVVDNDYINETIYGTREDMRHNFGDDYGARVVAKSGRLVLCSER